MEHAGSRRRIAVIGTGVAGLVAAHRLAPHHDVVVFERDRRAGGHSHTHDVEVGGRRLRVDTGFLVHNRVNYPNLCALLDELRVGTIESDMTFGVSDETTGIEWAGHSPAAVFAQPRNLVRPDFLRMLVDIVRLNRRARATLTAGGDRRLLEEWLDQEGFAGPVVDRYLLPLGTAIWSADPTTFGSFPAASMFRFLDHHGLLAVRGRPRWRTVAGGSRTYVDAIVGPLGDRVRLGCPVTAVERAADGLVVRSPHGVERFDDVVAACHADTTLDLVVDLHDDEREILGAIRFQANDAVLHTDRRLLPRAHRAWAAWNVHVPTEPRRRVSVTYHLNRLQALDTDEQVCVTLNRVDEIDPATVLATARYEHPVMDAAADRARDRRAEIQGRGGLWHAGAWWGWGFHEDGVVSALDVCRSLGVRT